MRKILSLLLFLGLTLILHAQRPKSSDFPTLGYRAFIELGSAMPQKLDGACRTQLWQHDLSTIHGYQFRPRFFLGIGGSMDFMGSYGKIHLDSGSTAGWSWRERDGIDKEFYRTSAFIFADMRFDFREHVNSPFLDLRLGYGERMPYVAAFAGLRVNKNSIALGISYRNIRAEYTYALYEGFRKTDYSRMFPSMWLRLQHEFGGRKPFTERHMRGSRIPDTAQYYRRGLRAIMDVELCIPHKIRCLSDEDEVFDMGWSAVIGYQFGQHLYMGAGFYVDVVDYDTVAASQVQYNNGTHGKPTVKESDEINAGGLQLLYMLRYDFNGHRTSPFTDMRLGTDGENFYSCLSMGFHVHRYNFSAYGEYKTISYPVLDESRTPVPDTPPVVKWFPNFGVRFGVGVGAIRKSGEKKAE